jgi:hypothetical protein
VQRSPVPQQVWSLRYGLVTGRSFGSEFSDSDLGSGESYYGSFRLGDVNGDGYMDACARFASGFKCARNNGDGTFASYAGGPSTGEFSDGLGWNASDHGTTIQLGDLNNDGMADVCGRGDAGIYCVLSTGDSFQGSSLWTTSFSNDSNDGVWNDSDSYYRSIDLGDIDGDGFADVCGRAADGVWCALNMRYPQGFNNATLWINEFTNGQGWNFPEYGATMQLGDVNGDGKADLCGRGIAGVYCAVSNGSAFVNPRVWTYRDNFSDWYGSMTAMARRSNWEI